ncbi:GNAT family N-acetyltransferase [Streptomyces oceani]|uniref:Acetyltransferase n=1 Tax=Streptomyces oceani TaxID=1075402 RepID=A0A1E7KJQ2_9ACTN|nr:GNAT family N-acetyltransferase [Streptomyces oceani]OEV04074.1 acetyltransferase [Streptomyces oceani]
MTTVQYRTLDEAHLDRALDHADLAFHEKTTDRLRKQFREMMLRCERVGAYDGESLVGLSVAIPFRMSVPGGELPAAGLTFVSVSPTHRRRGVLTGLLDEAWRRSAANGQPVAVLWASQDAIYGRFGFGTATRAYNLEIDSTRPLALRVTPDDRPLRLIDPERAPGVLAGLHAAHRTERAGRMARDDVWWRTEVLPEEDEHERDYSPPRVVVLGEEAPDSRTGGYAVYRTRREAGGQAVVRLDELEAETPEAAAALWQYLVAVDLTSKVRAPGRPLDDPLLFMAADRDQVRVVAELPAMWLRLVDPAAALAERSWAAPVDVVLEVTDRTLPDNAGRYRLTAGPGQRAVYRPADRAEDPPVDLSLDMRELGSCYLGGAKLCRMVRAGLVTEHTPGAAQRLDDALRTPLLPHAVDSF